jgi:hypothetical protein
MKSPMLWLVRTAGTGRTGNGLLDQLEARRNAATPRSAQSALRPSISSGAPAVASRPSEFDCLDVQSRTASAAIGSLVVGSMPDSCCSVNASAIKPGWGPPPTALNNLDDGEI